MTAKPRGRERFASLPEFRGDWITLGVEVPNPAISGICTFFEALDNVAVVRTPKQGESLVNITFWEGSEDLVNEALTEMSMEIPLRVAERRPGMTPILRTWE